MHKMCLNTCESIQLSSFPINGHGNYGLDTGISNAQMQTDYLGMTRMCSKSDNIAFTQGRAAKKQMK